MAEIRGSQERQRDPVIIGEFAYRMHKVRRAFVVCFAALVSLIGVGSFALFLEEVARLVVLFSAFLAVVIIFIIGIQVINTNDHCPACDEPPYRGRREGSVKLNIESCEACGVALK